MLGCQDMISSRIHVLLTDNEMPKKRTDNEMQKKRTVKWQVYL